MFFKSKVKTFFGNSTQAFITLQRQTRMSEQIIFNVKEDPKASDDDAMYFLTGPVLRVLERQICTPWLVYRTDQGRKGQERAPYLAWPKGHSIPTTTHRSARGDP